MHRLVLFLVLIGPGACIRAQDVTPYLRIETGAHTAIAKRIDVDSGERFLVSASDDKTVRVWDLHSGKLLKILRPPIGDFDEGKLYAVACSPDEMTVAVGGFTHAIYIFNWESGAIVKTITDLPVGVGHLAYSRDGRYLAAGLGLKNGIRIFETVEYSEVARDDDYGDTVYWIEFDKSGELVTTSDDGYVRLYGSNFRVLRKEKAHGGKQPYSARFSPNGSQIAVGFEDTASVEVLSVKDLSFQYELQIPVNARNFHAVSWSENGESLCAAGIYFENDLSPVLCSSERGKGKLSTLASTGGDTVADLRALRDGGIAFSTGDGVVGVLGSGGIVKWRTTSDSLNYKDWESEIPRLSSDGNTVEVTANYFDGPSLLHHNITFSVRDQKLGVETRSAPSLLSPVTSGLGISGWQNSSAPMLKGRDLPLDHNETSRSLAITKNKDNFVLGADWTIRRFNRQGKQIWRTGVPDVAWGVNISSDRRFVVAALGDGTIRWYNFDEGEEVLAVFVDRDLKRWVAWNPDGFFTFKDGGDELIGYQINRGPGQAGDLVKVDQLREVFYRPDLISQILGPGGAAAVFAGRNQIGDISKVLSAGLPPEIELISPAQAEVDGEYILEFRVKDMGGGSGHVVYRIDGVEIEGRDAVDIKGTGSNTIRRYIPVGSGQHFLTIAGRSANGKIEGTPSSVHLTGRQPVLRSNLYVIAAGISHYSNNSLNSGVRFAAADADFIAQKFKEQEGIGLYPHVNVFALPDSRATVKNIQDAVALAAKSVRAGDTFVLYLAGHGIAADGEYYFIPWEVQSTNQTDLLRNSLSRKDIQDLLKTIPTQNSVLILDTCGAGAFLGSGDMDSEKAAAMKVAVMSGRVVLAASNSKEMAMEGYENHGVFTYALVEGLTKADSDTHGDILVTRLGEYAQTWVPKITEQKWHYKQTPVAMYSSEPFPIAHKASN